MTPCHHPGRGNLTPKGYIRIKVNGKLVMAHRLAWEQRHGAIAPGLVIHHECHTRWCDNVEHLRPYTNAENIREALSRAISQRHKARTHCDKGHEFTPENTLWRSDAGDGGARRCRTCRRNYQAKVRSTPEWKEYMRSYSRHYRTSRRNQG